MSETREQYRERLGEINADASMYGEHENDAEGNAFISRDCFEEGAMAVATQVLKDMRDRFRSIERDVGSKAWAAGWAADEIERLASERDIEVRTEGTAATAHTVDKKMGRSGWCATAGGAIRNAVAAAKDGAS